MESFAEYTGRDETLKNLIAAGKKMSAAEQLEALVALGDTVRIGEELYPAPTLGTLVLLEVMQSPFVTGGAEVSGRDVLRGCLVLKLREAAIPPLLAVKQTAIGAESKKAEWEESVPSRFGGHGTDGKRFGIVSLFSRRFCAVASK